MEVKKWARHAQYMGVIIHMHVKICQKPEGIRPYAKLSHRWKMCVYILKRILKKCCVRMWTGFTWLKFQPSREFMDIVMNMCIHVPYKK
jgi:hypothetical protein